MNTVQKFSYWGYAVTEARSSGPETRTTPQVYEEGFELAKAIRRELFGYVGKAAAWVAVAFFGFVGAVLWGYIEWRLPQIAGAVPKNGVLAFHTEDCPKRWEPLKGGAMRVIVGAAAKAENNDDIHIQGNCISMSKGVVLRNTSFSERVMTTHRCVRMSDT